ncbi:ABC transporter permease subunit [Micromonospora endolithica]|uniref:ABC transporter permease n=1 Tax=Micromonospora endolithica TaxID=230091 RepID=A0A3A9ZQ03_9ACTN|nr:ABC transporter permease subunit [Micromonospora endolithica]RKN50265.1 ABC transporter permease [Micromonospora endolithica]TWJ21088.1 ABC-2 family transporter [Micromonospora endolithica]
MTTTTKLTFPRLVRSELTKQLSLRSTWIVMGVTILLAVGLSGVIANGYKGALRRGDMVASIPDAIASAFLPIDFVILILGVFGVLQITGEYSTGLIRATLTAVPRRLPVLAAKALVQIAITLPVMLVIAFGSFFLSQAVLGSYGASLGDAGVFRAVLGAAAAPILMGLLGLGIGTVLRHSAGAITTLVAILFVLPVLIAPALPERIADDVAKLTPTVTGQAMYTLGGGTESFVMLSAAASAGVLVGWAALFLLGGATLLKVRDA